MTLHTYGEYGDGRQVLSILSQEETTEAYLQGDDFVKAVLNFLLLLYFTIRHWLMRVNHISISMYCHLVLSKRASFERHGQ